MRAEREGREANLNAEGKAEAIVKFRKLRLRDLNC